MKVSRKVGRRSRFSISRRRLRNKKSYKKNSYRKKYTQKGGRRGRGHKRARTHIHKRGKRFHRGGAEFFIELSVKKNGKNIVLFEYPEKLKMFKMKITIPDNFATVELERTDNSSIKFTIKAEPDVFIDFLQHLNNAYSTKMGPYDFKELKVVNGNETYNFFTTYNIAKFKEIAEKIKKVKYDKDAELLRDELQKAEEYKRLNPNDMVADAKFNLADARVKHLEAVNCDKSNAEYTNIVAESKKLLTKAENKLRTQQQFGPHSIGNPLYEDPTMAQRLHTSEIIASE